MAKKLASWTKYQKKVKAKFSKVNSNTVKKQVEKNTINLTRAGIGSEAMLRLLIKKKILTVKEVQDIVDKELKKVKKI
jgi:mannitol-specific phosphotransferase system IIBC component